MACPDCSSITPLIFDIQSFISNSCLECQQQNCLPVKYLCYTGPALACSGIETGDTLEVALQKIDTQVCSALGDYSTYQFNCLTAWLGESITTEAQFVDAITAYACEIQGNVTTLIDTTFPAFQDDVDGRISDVEDPEITCVSAGVTSGDTLFEILEKYCSKFGEIDDTINIEGQIEWANCLTVIDTPTTIIEGFQLLVGQICTVYGIANAAAVLPVFNNSGNCLSNVGGTSSDTLVATIGYITDIICDTYPFVAFNPGDIDWDCLDDGSTNLQESFQVAIDAINANQKLLITQVSADFTLELVDPGDTCLGFILNLATPIVNNDRLVASNDTDTSPGTLINKLTAGTNISLDDTTTSGQVIINANNDHLVLAGPGDEDPGLLVDKLNGSSASGITITPEYNAGTEQVDLNLSVSLSILIPMILDGVAANSTFLAQFCSLVSQCGAECPSFTYTIDNESGEDQLVSWLVCGNNTPIQVTLPDGVSMNVCAVQDSVSEVIGVTVTEIAECTGGSPTTTTTTTTATP